MTLHFAVGARRVGAFHFLAVFVSNGQSRRLMVWAAFGSQEQICGHRCHLCESRASVGTVIVYLIALVGLSGMC